VGVLDTAVRRRRSRRGSGVGPEAGTAADGEGTGSVGRADGAGGIEVAVAGVAGHIAAVHKAATAAAAVAAGMLQRIAAERERGSTPSPLAGQPASNTPAAAVCQNP